MYLPNLYLAEDFFHFAVDASISVVKFAASVPVVVGTAVGLAIYEAAHLAARAFHFMGRALRWAIDELEYAFIMFARKVKHGLHKIGAGIKAGFHAIGHLAHEIGEGLEDGVSIIVDIGHHALHHHKCHSHCSNVGLVIGDDSSSSSSSSSSSEDCSCEEEEEITTITAICVEEEKVCNQKKFTAKIQANYNVELAWTEEECHEKVKTTLVEVNQAMTSFTADLKRIEADASAESLEE